MGKFIVTLVILGIQIYALVEALRAPSGQVRVMSKWLWVLVILLLSIVGAALWLFFGRPARTAPGSEGGGGGGVTLGPTLGPRPKGPVAPDDDPEFLKRLDEQTWAARMERLRRERGPKQPKPEDNPPPEENSESL